jgi:PAS domain S-box-containing protein
LNRYHIELELQNGELVNNQFDLQASHQKYADLYNLAPIAYFTFNSDGLIVDVNQAGLDLFGMKKKALINRCFSRYIVPEFQALFAQCRRRVLQENISLTCELKLLRWSASTIDAQLECKAIQDAITTQQQLLVCITDITARKLHEKSMHLQQVKMASIDRMRSMSEQIYSITRSQNHSLAVIDNYIYGCIRRLETGTYSPDELVGALRKVASQSRVLADVILRMKNFASKTIFRYEPVNINTMIKETLALIHYEILEFPIAIDYEPLENLPSVKIDKLHIQQVILNLARNSIEAMKDAHIAEPKLLIEVGLVNTGLLEIILFDNGPGIDQSIIHKIFDPHFTTKSYAVGLGLSVSRTIVEKHGGQLTAHMNALGGAYFKLTLPCVAQI